MTADAPILAVHYAEIALKGRNRQAFLRRLRNNIQAALRGEPVLAVRHVESRLLVRLRDGVRVEPAAAKLRRVFGIQWLSIATAVPRAAVGDDLAGLCAAAVALARRDRGEARTFKIDTRRSDRTFPLTSPQVNAAVGRAVAEAIGLPVSLSQPDFTVHILILQGSALIFTRKIAGHGGLPSGSGGRVLTLLSGGIDSPAAAFLMQRRGCRSDFVHFYSGRDAAEADAGKIRSLAGLLGGYALASPRLWLVPSYPYELRAIGRIDEPSDMVMFRRYMLKTAEAIARRSGCHALVTGDSLGQVASQTMFNLAAIGPDVALPVFRPLIGLDKHEISGLARQIGTFELSIQPYRDCCSIRSPHPQLRARARDLLEMSARMDLEGAVVEAVRAAARERVAIANP